MLSLSKFLVYSKVVYSKTKNLNTGTMQIRNYVEFWQKIQFCIQDAKLMLKIYLKAMIGVLENYELIFKRIFIKMYSTGSRGVARNLSGGSVLFFLDIFDFWGGFNFFPLQISILREGEGSGLKFYQKIKQFSQDTQNLCGARDK